MPNGKVDAAVEQSDRKFAAADYSKSYKSVEKDLGMGTGEIGTLVNYFSEELTLEVT